MLFEWFLFVFGAYAWAAISLQGFQKLLADTLDCKNCVDDVIIVI